MTVGHAHAVSASDWRELRSALLSYARRRVGGDEAVAEDIVQQVLLRGHQVLPSLRDTRRLSAWLHQATRNALVDHHRASRPGDPLPRELVGDYPASGSDETRAELARCLTPLLHTMPGEYADAVTWHDLEGMPHRALADRLGLSVSGARSRVQRGRALLRDALLACCEVEVDARGAPIGTVSRVDSCVCGGPSAPGEGEDLATGSLEGGARP